MGRTHRTTVHRALLAGAGLAAAVLAPLARADDHALILWIGQYADAQVRIVGVDQDARLARGMARAMGVPERNITELKNSQLTHAGIKTALAGLQGRIRAGDSVMLYFSGHGQQRDRVLGGGGCSEGLATFEGGVYYDVLLRDQLDALADVAKRVVMFNDSCHSGGAVTKSFEPAPTQNPDPESLPKSYPGPVTGGRATAKSSGDAVDPGYACGVASNAVSKAMGDVSDRRPGRVLYLAAAAADEAAFPSAQGSIATRAWSACLQSGRAFDADKDGFVSGAELQRCAQDWVQSKARYRQTITVVGNGQLPVGRY